MGRRILVSGATGLIGAALVRKFAAEGHSVAAAVRNIDKGRGMFGGLDGVTVVGWDVTQPLDVGALGCVFSCVC